MNFQSLRRLALPYLALLLLYFPFLVVANAATPTPTPNRASSTPSLQTKVAPPRAVVNRAQQPALKTASPAPKAVSASVKKKDEEVNLNELNALPPAVPPLSAGGSGASPSQASNASYGTGQRLDLNSVFFHFYFDFWLINRPGFGPLTFQNIHSLSMVEAQPREDIFFSSEISPSPRYFEVKYAPVGKKWNLRVGKIWVPFDDVNPHNHFGGRTNTRQLLTGNALFLPNFWTELGIAFETKLFDFRGWKGVGTAYIVNGFGAGGKNPSGDAGEYPSFQDIDVLATDNNNDKAVGGRLQFNYKQSVEVGFSVYTGRWSSQIQASKRLTLLGADAGYQFNRFELRGGILAGTMELMDGKAKKGGAYAEFWTKLLPERNLRVALKAGVLQPDDRYIGTNDLQAVGAGMYYRPNIIQYSIEHSQDIQHIAGKKGYGITWARLSILI